MDSDVPQYPVRGKKVTVVGLGRTALPLVWLLLREGARPFVTERDDGERFVPLRKELDSLGVPYECGGHTDAAVEGAAYVVPSPGVPLNCRPVVRAQGQGVDVIGEIEYAFPFCRSRILAVTGTNGKTTTTELLRTLVAGCGHSVLLAGNNDVPFSSVVQIDPPPDFIVLEVSSYQLESIRRFRPWAGVVLNVTPDHLDRHGTIEAYAAVKARLFENQKPGDVAVVNLDNEWTRAMRPPAGVAFWRFSRRVSCNLGLWLDGDLIRAGAAAVAHVADTPLPGRHNLENVLAALTIMRATSFDWGKTVAALRTFEGVEHRIEFVARVAGVDFFNDSKSTNIDSLKVALESFERPIVLLAGGRGKGADYRVLRALVRGRVKKMITIGEDAALLEAAFGDLVGTERAADMKDAVLRAVAAATPGDVVLLSPACASFDMFHSFEHRGREFKECVREYQEGTGS